MKHQLPVSSDARAVSLSDHEDSREVAPDLAYKRLAIVNVVFFGLPGAGAGNWILIDTGLPLSAGPIREAAAERFGEDTPPAAILLTHGHFDHVGSLKPLAEEWDVPIYAHPAEHRYLNGQDRYPPPDPGVEGGLMAKLSPLFPRGPVDVRRWLRPLPEDRSVPGMAGWEWIPTPGHTPGHVSFWRASDRALIVGDAFITTRQESVYAALTQKPEMHGPPRYYTPDWESARASVETLAALEPELVITGHGAALRGPEMQGALRTLADDFERVAVPEKGRDRP